jgi:hypothetical protein
MSFENVIELEQPQSESSNNLTRLENWARADIEVKKMLGLSELPNQSLTNTEWNQYEARLKSGDELAVHELMGRRLRSIYLHAERCANESPYDLATTEDYFDHIYYKCMQLVSGFGNKSSSKLEELFFRPYYSATTDSSVAIRTTANFPTKPQADVQPRSNLIREGNFVDNWQIGGVVGLDSHGVDQTVETEAIKANQNMFRKASHDPEDEIDRNLPTIEEEVVRRRDVDELYRAIDQLRGIQAFVLTHALGLKGCLPKPRPEIAALIGRTPVRVRQLETAALKDLRKLYAKEYPEVRDESYRLYPREVQSNYINPHEIIETISIDTTMRDRTRRTAETALMKYYPGDQEKIDMTSKQGRQEAVIKSLAAKILSDFAVPTTAVKYTQDDLRTDTRGKIEKENLAARTITREEYDRAIEFLISKELLEWEEPLNTWEEPTRLRKTSEEIPHGAFDD